MKAIWVHAVLLLAVTACASAPTASGDRTPPDAKIVRGTGYRKSVYEHDGRTVVSFQVDVSNKGTETGRSANARCHVRVDGELHQLEILQNPDLAPGEDGVLLTGGPIPPLTHGEIDDLDVYCGL